MAGIELTIASPNCIEQSEIDTFCKLVRSGGEVDSVGLEGRVKMAKALVFLQEDKRPFGVAAIKQPNGNYTTKVFQKAGVPEYACKFQLELGWVVVEPEHQGKGYSYVLSDSAMTQAERKATFATTRLDNIPMLKTLERIGFRRYGDSWQGRNHRLVLYVKT